MTVIKTDKGLPRENLHLSRWTDSQIRLHNMRGPAQHRNVGPLIQILEKSVVRDTKIYCFPLFPAVALWTGHDIFNLIFNVILRK